MYQFWRRWTRPWKRSQIAKRYIESSDYIGIRRLAEDSGVAKGTIERWCREENWVEQRQRFEDVTSHLTTDAKHRSLEQNSSKLGEELAEIAIADYKAHKLPRDYAIAIFQIKAMHLQLIMSMSLDEQMKQIKMYHSAHEMNFWSQIIKRSTDGIEQVTGMDYYVSGNAAVKRIEDMGASIIFAQEHQDIVDVD